MLFIIACIIRRLLFYLDYYFWEKRTIRSNCDFFLLQCLKIYVFHGLINPINRLVLFLLSAPVIDAAKCSAPGLVRSSGAISVSNVTL